MTMSLPSPLPVSAPCTWRSAVLTTTIAAKKDSTAPRRGEAGYLDSMPDRGSRGMSLSYSLYTDTDHASNIIQPPVEDSPAHLAERKCPSPTSRPLRPLSAT